LLWPSRPSRVATHIVYAFRSQPQQAIANRTAAAPAKACNDPCETAWGVRLLRRHTSAAAALRLHYLCFKASWELNQGANFHGEDEGRGRFQRPADTTLLRITERCSRFPSLHVRCERLLGVAGHSTQLPLILVLNILSFHEEDYLPVLGAPLPEFCLIQATTSSVINAARPRQGIARKCWKRRGVNRQGGRWIRLYLHHHRQKKMY
jgi:hypothetical protein